jgi:hypothetical protein
MLWTATDDGMTLTYCDLGQRQTRTGDPGVGVNLCRKWEGDPRTLRTQERP